MKLGIEMEFWTVDETGRLCESDDVVAAHEQFKPEFVDHLVEVQTTPHESESAMRRELQETLTAGIEAAESEGVKLVPLGTPLTTATSTARDERGRLFERIYGDGVESAKHCAGTHVHFEQGAVRRQLNLLTALDPAIALVNSSPYYHGERGAASARAAAYRWECGEEFRLFCDLWSYAESVSDWKHRVVDAYETFRELAAERGVHPHRIDEQFTPEDTVLHPVRLREQFPTVEWRAPDTALPSQVVDLAFDVRRLVAQTGEKSVEVASSPSEVGVGPETITVPEFSSLTTLSNEAIRWGLNSNRVHEYLVTMGFDVTSYDPITEELGGPRELREAEARDLRLEWADRLRADVASLAADADRNRVATADTLFGIPGR